MATVTFDQTGPFVNTGTRTTDATATDVANQSFSVADKSDETYEIDAWAVRENVGNPLAWYQKRIVAVRWVAGAPVFLDGSDGANGIVMQHGDAAMACTMVLGAAPFVKVQVTGLVATTFNWAVKVTRSVLSSLP